MPTQYIEMDLRNKTTSEFRTVFHSLLGVPIYQVSLHIILINVKLACRMASESRGLQRNLSLLLNFRMAYLSLVSSILQQKIAH